MNILVTGGAGFIGSNFVLNWMVARGSVIRETGEAPFCGH
jgi:nucleoside-diphosphate-sugar epimerase